MKKILFTLFICFYACISIYAGGLKGTIKDKDGIPLGFVTLYIKEIGTGTTANEDGQYEISLPSGSYTVIFQLMGYETQIHNVTIGTEFLALDIIMSLQSNMLKEVTITASKEYLAYTIMRKAIAKAKYHTQQLDSYSAKVYTKGTGQLKDYPWLLKKEMKKEGIEKDRVFITESVSHVEYTRPNTFKEKVISVHSDGNDNNTSPNEYIFGSFYSPEIAQTISPLSPKAFSYYRFEYLGSFQDRDYMIDKIKVTPRLKGDNVVEGILFIVEDAWSIHSLDFTTTRMGINIQIKQIYAPIDEKVWQPVSHRFQIHGDIFGFEFEYNYLATVSNYKIELNKELYVDKMDLIDETLEKERAKEMQNTLDKDAQSIQKRLEEGKAITRKELRTVVKEYEKQETKSKKKQGVISDYTFEKDSIKFQKDTAYWNNIRPVPLTEQEINGYKKIDSIAKVEKNKEAQDSVKHRKQKGFQPWDLLTGDSYKIFKHSYFSIETPGGGFNTVEGLNFIYKLKFSTNILDTNNTRFSVTPTFRYGIASQQLYSKITALLKNKKYTLNIDGGRYIKQFNKDEPILPITNSFTTLFFERNLMKIYQQDFINVSFRSNITPKIFFDATSEWANRQTLQNNTNYKLIDIKNIEGYTSNNPINNEYGGEVINSNSNALKASISISTRPWLKYKIRNKIKREVENSSAVLSLRYTKGMQAIKSNVNYDLVEAGVIHRLRFGVRGTLDLRFNTGLFINNKKLYFMDYKHFLGNKTLLTTADPTESFRLLDYYTYSTRDKYFSANINYQFRRFLITNLLYVRMLGIRENIFINYLATPASNHYTEIGYSIDGLLRIFRIEAVASFQEGKYMNYGFRWGIATTISARFSE